MPRKRRKRRSWFKVKAFLLFLALVAVAWGVNYLVVSYDDLIASSADPDLTRILIAAAALAVAASFLFVWRTWSRRRRTRQRHFEQLLALTPAQFEETVGHILTDLGYRRVCRVGQSGDLGADLTATDPSGRHTVVQCKRLAPGSRIGSPRIQTFIGMMAVHHRAEAGVFVTTAEFTEPARELAEEHDITLMDGAHLSETLLRLKG